MSIQKRAFRRQAVVACLITAAGCLAAIDVATPSNALGGQTTSPPAAEPPLTGADSTTYDNAALAHSLGISASTVAKEIALQDAMDTVDFPSLDPGFAEYGSTMGQPFEIWYRSAQPPSAQMRRVFSAIGVTPYLKVEQVPLSASDLTSLAQSVFNAVQQNASGVGVTYDTASGKIIFHYRGDITPETRDAAQGDADRLGAAWEWGDAPGVSDIGGGRPLDRSDNVTCTAGFVIRDGSDRSLATAGHCGAVGSVWSYQGNRLTTEARKISQYHDASSVDSSSVTFTNIVFDGVAQRTINGQRAYSSMNIGDPVEKYGRTTGYTNGTIAGLHACYVPDGVSSGCAPDSTFVRVADTAGQPWSQGGDSGGPAMHGSIAYGLDVGHFDNGDGIFYPIDFLNGAIGMVLYTG